MCLEKAQSSKMSADNDTKQTEQTTDEDTKVIVKPVDPAVEKRYKKLVQYAKKNGYPEL